MERLQFGDPVRVLTKGTTCPILCNLEDGSGGMSLWVVKFCGSRPEALVAEATAAVLAGVFAVDVPRWGTAVLPETEVFDDKRPEGKALNDQVRKNPGGTVFCSRYLVNGIDHESGGFARRDPKVILRLFLFDAFIWNFDRAARVPNLMWDDRRLVAIDHGRAFWGVMDVQDSGLSAYSYTGNRVMEWRDHCAFGYLREQAKRERICGRDIEAAVAAVQDVDTADLVRRSTDWPTGLGPVQFQGDFRLFLRKRFESIDSLTEDLIRAIES